MHASFGNSVRLLSGICIDCVGERAKLRRASSGPKIVRYMSITISADDPRTIRAIEIAARADQWRVLRQPDGDEAYMVPSQSDPDRVYLVTRASCDCLDFRRTDPATAAPRLEGEQRACKHMLAVRLYQELVRAAQALQPRPIAPRQRGHLRLVP
jgi:hypothetical protein